MDDDNGQQNNTKVSLPHTLYRGVYRRVAAQIGVDPSYVSRVARGERISLEIQNSLAAELDRIAALNRRPRGLARQDGPLIPPAPPHGVAHPDAHWNGENAPVTGLISRRNLIPAAKKSK